MKQNLKLKHPRAAVVSIRGRSTRATRTHIVLASQRTCAGAWLRTIARAHLHCRPVPVILTLACSLSEGSSCCLCLSLACDLAQSFSGCGCLRPISSCSRCSSRKGICTATRQSLSKSRSTGEGCSCFLLLPQLPSITCRKGACQSKPEKM
jgi:hypothetical protein